jgi:N-acetylmuramoyl-L-alanine amidase
VAQQLAPLLEREGARVVLTRTDARPVALTARVPRADSAGADLLISLHNNALPDGINPFTNQGASVFYNHPRALPLARAIQRRLVALTGLPDLGVARGDLALTRATWMPAVLTEGMFLMIPEQEAALRSAEGRRLYALAVLEGLRSFLLALAR